MNKRIKELIKEANVTVIRKKANQIYGGPLVEYESTEFSREKFAELIVQECADRLMQDDFKDFNSVMFHAGLRLKKHFGIEE